VSGAERSAGALSAKVKLAADQRGSESVPPCSAHRDGHPPWRGSRLTPDGAFVGITAPHTGRSPSDKFIVRDDSTVDTVWWDNTRAMSPEQFAVLEADFLAHAKGRDLFVQQLNAGSDAAPIFSVDVFTETAWHALFIRQLLVPAAGADFAANATILHMPSFKADPARHGTRTQVVIALDTARNIVLIGGTAYAGEIKKSVFSLFNYHAPDRGILPMHCSANIGADGSTALFFGLSGTGKTTLSTDPRRALIGDDEHGWTAERRLQPRRRLLRQDRQSRSEIGARDFRGDQALRHRARERRLRRRRPAHRISTTSRPPRTAAPPTR
jgi:ATP-dependent phosphoenolpyruvate carboxykinase